MDMIPLVLQEEHTRVKGEIQGKPVVVIFDGMTGLGEVLVLVVRFFDGWAVKQRLVSVQFLQKTLNGEELARQIISVLSVSLDIESGRLLAAIRDGASVNTAALCTAAIVYPYILDIICISHTLETKVRALWKERTGRSMATYSQTCW